VQQFIADGERLLGLAERSHDHPEFRKWRLGVQSRVDQAQSEYQLSAPFYSWQRMYRGRSSTTSRSVFDQELSDSLNELRLIVDHYEKDGEPPRRKATNDSGQLPAVQSKPPDAKETISLKWLQEHVPFSSLFKWVSVVFISGVAVGAAAADFLSIGIGEVSAWILNQVLK
jgi:hypothetical protein